MINSLALILLLSFFKLLAEDGLLLILMVLEMISMLSFFVVLSMNPETMSLTSCAVAMLTIMVSESVMSLSIFISLMRTSSMTGLTALGLKY